MSKSGNGKSDQSPIKDKVAVASKHRGVFMETAEFEAETGTKLSSDIEESISVTQEEEVSLELLDDPDENEQTVDEPIEPRPVRKKVHPRSKKKRFTKKVLIFTSFSINSDLKNDEIIINNKSKI